MIKDNNIKEKEWCPNADLNHGHADFQSAALPTELFGHFTSCEARPFQVTESFALPKVSGVITSCSAMSSA